MSTVKTGFVSTPNASATTILQDNSPTVPLPDTPQGIMCLGPRVTFHFVQNYSQASSYNYYDVVNVDGTSYIAIRDVPSNTPISDTDYWAMWNDPNAQFKLLQDTVESFDARINDSETSIAEIEEKIQDSVILVFGDSWSNYNLTSQPYWHSYIGEYFNENVLVYANAGAGFVVSNNTISMQVTEAIGAIVDKSTVNKIYIMCGVNDYTRDMASVQTTAATVFSTLKQNFPNAEILFIQNGNSASYMSVVSQATYSVYVKAACMAQGVRYLNLSHVILDNINYENDNAHPSQQGGRILAFEILSNGCEAPVNINARSSFVTEVDDDDFTVDETSFRISGNGMFYARGTIQSTSGKTINDHYLHFGGNVDVATVQLMARDSDNNQNIPGQCLLMNPYNAVCNITTYDFTKPVSYIITGRLAGR